MKEVETFGILAVVVIILVVVWYVLYYKPRHIKCTTTSDCTGNKHGRTVCDSVRKVCTAPKTS